MMVHMMMRVSGDSPNDHGLVSLGARSESESNVADLVQDVEQSQRDGRGRLRPLQVLLFAHTALL